MRRDGAAVALPASKKTRALLGYLAATGKPQLRERLCTLLWDGPDNPRAALRWSLTKLRPLVDDAGAPRLVADREHVELAPAGALLDLAVLRAAVPGGVPAGAARASTDALRAAAKVIRGDLLEGLDLPDCYRWDEWCRAEREATRRLAIGVVAALVERLREREPDEALTHARARVTLDPLDEAAHAAVIQLLVALDRRAEALAQHASCTRLFERELGRGPSRELDRLRVAIAAMRADVPAVVEPAVAPAGAPVGTPAAAPASVTVASTPLIGRAQERETLRAALASSPAEVVVVLGDPGIGKTRLLEELAALARAGGAAIAIGRCVEAEMVRPYGAWIDALGELAGSEGPFHGAGRDGDRALLFETVTAWLNERAASRPIAIMLDDVQWIDEGSAALLHFVARADASAGRIRLACAARPGELADNAAAVRLLRGLGRAGRIRQIGLSPLDAADTAALAALHAPGVDATRVFAESGGHPLFAVEIARALARGDTAWASLDALIGERLDLLDSTARQVVPWAAALGRAFTPEVLAAITGMSLADLSRAVEELERRAVVRAIGSEWDFAHDLVRDAAYHRVSEPRRRLLHLQIARAVTAMPDPAGELAGEVARHAGLGGDGALCASASLVAAERCLRLFAPEEALVLVDRGLPHARRLVGPERGRLEIGLLRVASRADTGRRRRGSLVSELARAVVDAQAAGSHAAAAIGSTELARLHYDAGDFASAYTEAFDAVARSQGADPASQAHALAHSAQCLAVLDRDFPQVEVMARSAAELMARTGSEVPELPFALGVFRHHQGDDDAAVALLLRSSAIAARAGNHWQQGIGLARAAMVELARGRPREALACGGELRAMAAKIGESADIAVGGVIEAVAALALDPSRTDDDIEAALVILRAADAPNQLAGALICAGEVELASGRLAAATRHAAEAVTAAARSGRCNELALAAALTARLALVERRDPDARAALGSLGGIDRVQLGARARRALDEVEAALAR